MAAASSSSFNTRVMAFVVPYPKLTSLSSPLKNIPSVPSKYCPPTTTCAISRTRINTRKATHLNLKASTIDVDAYMGDDYNTRYITQYDDTDATLPRHVTNEDVNNIITKAEKVIQDLQKTASALQDQMEVERLNQSSLTLEEEEDDVERDDDVVFANSYVDLGKVDTVGFDYDYTLVTYTNELLELIYDMALKRLVEEKQYPSEMLDAGLKFDPNFSIRGLAVDRETGWICHLSYTHKVAVAWEGRTKLSRQRLMDEYSGKRALNPTLRKKRLKPLNDLFSMAECCLIADTVQFFKDMNIPFCPRNAVVDILGVIGSTHISGDFHRIVAQHPERYLEPQPHLKGVLEKLKKSGKRLIFVSNSPFWYVDAGMNYVIGENWRDTWDVVIVSAGKPRFYTDNSRPFREVSTTTGRVKFKKVERLEPGEVYTEGCLRQLTKCIDWYHSPVGTATTANGDTEEEDDDENVNELQYPLAGGGPLTSPNVLYVGDSLFADLVDAKRQFGWTTAAVTPEVEHEIEMQSQTRFVLAQRTIDVLLQTLRSVQYTLGAESRSEDDLRVIDGMERLISKCRDEQTNLLGNSFGSVFRARYQPSLFAHSLRRYCDLYMSSVSSMRHYSPEHRFYPEDARLLSHEIRGGVDADCWTLDTAFENADGLF